MKIPKIIHQVYEDPNGPPDSLKILSESWIEKNPDWQYVFWSKKEMENLVKEFPDFMETYYSFPFSIQRWDAIRYLILYKHGGLYVDMDYECLAEINEVLTLKTCFLGLEPEDHAKKYNRNFLPGNAFMASIPNHPFWLSAIDYMRNLNLTDYDENNKVNYILETTGPFMIAEIYNNYKNQNEIGLVSDKLVAPLSQLELFILRSSMRNKIKLHPKIENKIDNASAIHYFFGGWYSDI